MIGEIICIQVFNLRFTQIVSSHLLKLDEDTEQVPHD